MKCCVRGCETNYWRCPPRYKSYISFHRFPNDESYRDLWLAAIGGNVEERSIPRICSRHFEKKDFITLPTKRELKTNAVPQLCLPSQSNEGCTSTKNLSSETEFGSVSLDKCGTSSHEVSLEISPAEEKPPPACPEPVPEDDDDLHAVEGSYAEDYVDWDSSGDTSTSDNECPEPAPKHNEDVILLRKCVIKLKQRLASKDKLLKQYKQKYMRTLRTVRRLKILLEES